MSISVAIVEDDAPVRELLVEWVTRAEGFRCVGQHGDTASALAHLPAEKPAIVLVDINLPGLNGIECVRRLKALLPETLFVMLTVYQDSNHIFEALAAGAVGYLLKQTPYNQLITALKLAHKGGSPMTSYIARKVVQSFQEQQVPDIRVKGPAAEVLSAREREVLELLARGHFYKEICAALAISKSTVNTHIRNIYEKLQVHTRAKAIAMFMPPVISKRDRS